MMVSNPGSRWPSYQTPLCIGVLSGLLGILLGVAGCSRSDGEEDVLLPPAGDLPSNVKLPPANAALDYQLAEPYPPAADVAVLSRDRTATPAPGRYNICYVNGFQTQPGEREWWLSTHPDLVLRDGRGVPVIDPEWIDEFILDISTADKRIRLLEIVGAWIDGCASAGFQGVEIDNLDTYTRFPKLLSEDAAVRFIRALSDRAHAAGLAIGQKNSAELLARRGDTALDFAVVEQCNEFKECGDFTAVYGDQVYVIEYQRSAFATGCARFPQISIVFRDLAVSAPGSASYVREGC
jgi:Glycoside-hydrolase family GH114